MAAPKVYDWWRVVWARKAAGGPIYGRGQRKATPRFRQCSNGFSNRFGDGEGTWRHRCYFPRRFYPEVYDLPTHRREIELFPELKNPQR